MAEKKFSAEIQMVIQKAQTIAGNNFHSSCTTAHCFLAVISVLKDLDENKGEPFTEYRTKFKEIINKNGLNGENYKEAFKEMYPHQTPKEGEQFTVNCGSDISVMLKNLDKLAVIEKRQVGIADFVREMFSDRSYDVFQVIELALNSSMKTEAIQTEMLEYFKMQTPKMTSIKDFENVRELTNINEFVANKKMTFVDCEPAIDQIRLALSCKSISCAALVGKAGTGKTMNVYAFADAINKGKCPGFNDKLVYQFDISSCVAGSKFRGEFEEKFLNIIELVKQYQDKVILFIDELHTIMGAGGSSDGAMDGANILKPYLSRGELKIIGATTDDEYSKFIENDKAMARRFSKILISEPTKEQTLKILNGLKDEYDSYFSKEAEKEIIEKVVEMSCKYDTQMANPSKAIGMMDLAYAHSKVFNEQNKKVNVDDILEAIRIKYDIKVSETRAEDTKKELKKNILGQDEVLEKINTNLKYVELGLIDNEKPLFSAICAGPTGVGKTFMAQLIAKNYFGSEKNLIKINMGEYGSEMDVSKITGSSKGYVGYDDEPDLVKSIKQYPNSVVLFDEIEKAHPKVFDTLLSILDTGEMKTNKGDSVSFKNAIILFTTNLGYKAGHSKNKGLGFIESSSTQDDILEAVKKHFRPEFINRIDEIIVFNSLNDSIAEELIERYKAEYEKTSGLKFKLSKKDIEEIKKEADIPEYGARGLKRAVRKQLLKVAKK